MGPLPKTDSGNKYIVNVIDCFTKYIISSAISDMKSITIANVLIKKVFLRFGTPTEITSDNQPSLVSSIIKDIYRMLDIHGRTCSPYHSAGNAIVERSFRTFQDILSKYINTKQTNWDEFLEAVEFCYNTTTHITTLESPYFLNFARDPVLPIHKLLNTDDFKTYDTSDYGIYRMQLIGELRTAWNSAAENLRKNAEKMKLAYDKWSKDKELAVGDMVLFKNFVTKTGTSHKLALKWSKPYRVIKIENLHAVIVSMDDPRKKAKCVHINQIKPYFEPRFPANTLHSNTNPDSDTNNDIKLAGHNHELTPEKLSVRK
jgi:hypothetical protein